MNVTAVRVVGPLKRGGKYDWWVGRKTERQASARLKASQEGQGKNYGCWNQTCMDKNAADNPAYALCNHSLA